MPDGFENKSVRYFSTSIRLACAVEIIEYKKALHFAPRSVLLKSRFLPLTCNVSTHAKKASSKAIPHRACAEDALSDFSSDRIEIPQAYYRMSRDFCAR